jgi:poly [ADP-ribose] polymerase 2/3/4
VLNSLVQFKAESDLLELMKDMVKMTQKNKSLLKDDNVDQLYQSLGCDISFVAKNSAEFKQVNKEVEASQKKSHGVQRAKVKNVFKVVREQEQKAFNDKVGNVQTLFHGSRISNWVGLLSRGILMPKVVVSMGVHRTDPGWYVRGWFYLAIPFNSRWFKSLSYAMCLASI